MHEKIKKKAIIKYEGQPEYVRDWETISHYFLYIWNRENTEAEHEWRAVKAQTLEMWFEGKFEMKDRITLDDLYVKNDKEKAKCQACQGEEEQYIPPPDDGRTKTYVC